MDRTYKLVSFLVIFSLLSGQVTAAFAGTNETNYHRNTILHNPKNSSKEVDIVFVMDTSGSMDDDFSALCGNIQAIVDNLNAQGVNVNYKILGITGTRQCTSQTAQQIAPGKSNHEEDWGPAVRDIASGYAWQGITRVIIPVSDEGPQDGDDCNSPGDDEDSIIEAITAANANQVRVSPIVASGANTCTEKLAGMMASGTGGSVFFSTSPAEDLANFITDLISQAISDRDRDGIADDEDPYPDDPCLPDPQAVCLPPQVCGISNTPHWNDDNDGQVDEETMDDQDNDGDGLIDEDVGGVNCPFPSQDCGVTSHRGFDDDNDGTVDEEIDNQQDDDGDNYIDEDVACPCPAEQDLDTNDTPGIDDDHDFIQDEEQDDGQDNDGDGCIDEDVGISSLPDLELTSIYVAPTPSYVMEFVTIGVNIINSGSDYLPILGTVLVEIYLLDSQDSSGEARLWVIPGEIDAIMGGTGENYQFEFKFVSTKYDDLRICIIYDDPEANAANNCASIPVEVTTKSAALECLGMLIDVLQSIADVYTLGGASTSIEILRYFSEVRLFRSITIHKYCFEDQAWGKCGKEIGVVAIDGIVLIAKEYLKNAGLIWLVTVKNLIKVFLSGMECGDALASTKFGEFMHGLLASGKNKGYKVNVLVARSPINMYAIDQDGNRAGFREDGTILTEIANAEVFQEGDTKVVIYPGNNTKEVRVFGTGNGEFDLDVDVFHGEKLNTVFYDDVPINSGAEGRIDVTLEELILEIDDDGDTIYDREVVPVVIELDDDGIPKTYVTATPPIGGGSSSSGHSSFLIIVVFLALGGLGVYIAVSRRRRRVGIFPGTGAQFISPTGQIFQLYNNYIVGRGSASGYRVMDRGVSRKHAALRYADGAWFIQDMGSAGGTFVNGQRVQAQRLNNGDQITIGNTTLIFQER